MVAGIIGVEQARIVFPLFRFFVASSAVVVIAIAVVTVLHRHSEVKRLINLAERQNTALGKSFANSFWPRFYDHVISASNLSEAQLRQRPETQKIQQSIITASAGLPVLKIKIYDLTGRTVYSTDPAEIGENKSNNPGYFAAARNGDAASKLVFRNSLSSFEGVVQSRSLVESYLPLVKDGSIQGVFELYTDVTPMMTEIELDTKKLILGFVVAFGVVYGILFPIVRRADKTIRLQYSEITDKNTALKKEVADRRRAEDALILTIDTTPVGIVSLDLDGRITSANVAFCRMLCCGESDVLGKPLNSLIHPQDQQTNLEARHMVKGARQTAGPVRTRFLRLGGDVVFTELHLAIAVDSVGEPIQFIAQISDISERVQLEREMELQRGRLAHVSRVSTLGEMAAGIAHEINQPLTAIASFADGCARMVSTNKVESQTLAEALRKISAQAQRAGEVIKRLREMVRQGNQEREFADINELIADVLDLAMTDARTLDIHIELQLARGLNSVRVDKIQIQQVLLNLLRNAMDSLDPVACEQMVIKVVTASSEDPGIMVSVVDRGTGVSADIADKLFSPFVTTKASGMGIGLSVCKSIVRAHDGRLWYTANPGGGSAFHFTLPTSTQGAAHPQ